MGTVPPPRQTGPAQVFHEGPTIPAARRPTETRIGFLQKRYHWSTRSSTQYSAPRNSAIYMPVGLLVGEGEMEMMPPSARLPRPFWVEKQIIERTEQLVKNLIDPNRGSEDSPLRIG